MVDRPPAWLGAVQLLAPYRYLLPLANPILGRARAVTLFQAGS
jgi:hypothetical protein